MAGERRKVRGLGGNVVWVDIDRDMDQRTFDAMVERGDLTVLDEPKAKPGPSTGTSRHLKHLPAPRPASVERTL